MKKFIFVIMILSFLSSSPGALAIEVAPRISDREIVERLSRLEEGQKRVESRIDDLRSETIARFEAVDKRFESIDKRFDDLRSEMIARFDLLTWVFGLFITVALVILGFLVRVQWQMQRRQTQMETSLETQKDEMMFLKSLIEKLLPPKGAL